MKAIILGICSLSLATLATIGQQDNQPAKLQQPTPAKRIQKPTQQISQQQQQPDNRVQSKSAGAFMRAKLVGSQKVLDGLVSEDFTLIRSGAASMKQMSLAVQWPTADDKVYQHFGEEFRRQCDQLVELADAKNLQGTHYTYLHMTTTCINCHNYVRKEFRIEPSTTPHGPIRLIPTEWEGQSQRKDRRADKKEYWR